MFRTSVCASVLLIVTTQLYAEPIVVDSINATAINHSTDWQATEVGWFYTPTFAYDLVSVETRFRTADTRTVTLEVYDEHPEEGGSLLRTATFTPVGGEFAGGTFSALGLTPGEDYFIGFRSTAGLGVNVTSDPGAVNLPGGLRFSLLPGGSGFEDGPESGTTAQPILQFLGEGEVGGGTEPELRPAPEPSSLLLGTLGALGMAGYWRRRKTQPAA